MKRKVNLVGKNTLTVSLPNRWANKYGIKKGDDIELIDDDKNLIISKEGHEKKIKRISLDISNFNYMMLKRYLQESYRQGVEEMDIIFNKDSIIDYKSNKRISVIEGIKKLLPRFIGMEIISQKNNKIVLQSLITKEECEKRDAIRRRIYFLIKEFTEEFKKALKKDFNTFYEQAYPYHDNIAKFTYYYLRLINFSNVEEPLKSRIFGLYDVIDRCIDKIRHASQDINQMKEITPKIKKYLKEIFDQFLLQFEVLNKKCKGEDLEDIIKKRYETLQRMDKEKLTYEEFKVLNELRPLLDSMPNFAETYVALHLQDLIE